ncbi:hypothetical protein FACS1894167_12240 [Synergistales bacterium]|nr:hypothetical protein FACS1894167_12240 [Synergistales bacterium]
MKIRFIEHRFNTKAAKWIEVLDGLATEYLSRGRRLTSRHAFYRLVGMNIVQNTEKAYKAVCGVIDNGKQAGLLDWGAFEDLQRTVKGDTEEPYHGAFDIDIREAVKRDIETCFSSGMWAGQPYYIEVYTEKSALVSIIGEAANKWNRPYLSCRGYSSNQTLYEAACRFKKKFGQGKKCVLLYVGDSDPSGENMVDNIRGKLERFGADSVNVRKVALTLEQAQAYDLPPQMVKDSDSRAASYRLKHNINTCWECDALEPDVLQRMVSEAIGEYFDDGIREANIAEMEEYKLEQWERYKPILDRIEELTA